MNRPNTLESVPHRFDLGRLWKIVLGLLIAIAVVGGLAVEWFATRPVRNALNVYTALVTASNRPDLTDDERLEAASALCSERFRREHPLEIAPEGGIVGIPRNISKNFKAWREGSHVWVCPTNRIGPIYQFVYEDGRWKFDGLVGMLRAWGEVVPLKDLSPSSGGFGSEHEGSRAGKERASADSNAEPTEPPPTTLDSAPSPVP
jgi:hypothetical protein